MQEEGKEVGLVSGTLQPTAALIQAGLCLTFLLVAANTSYSLSAFCSPCQGAPMCPPPRQPPRPASVMPHFTSCPYGCGHPPRLSLLVSGCLSSLLWALHKVPTAASGVGEGGAADEEWVQLPRPEEHTLPALSLPPPVSQ